MKKKFIGQLKQGLYYTDEDKHFDTGQLITKIETNKDTMFFLNDYKETLDDMSDFIKVDKITNIFDVQSINFFFRNNNDNAAGKEFLKTGIRLEDKLKEASKREKELEELCFQKLDVREVFKELLKEKIEIKKDFFKYKEVFFKGIWDEILGTIINSKERFMIEKHFSMSMYLINKEGINYNNKLVKNHLINTGYETTYRVTGPLHNKGKKILSAKKRGSTLFTIDIKASQPTFLFQTFELNGIPTKLNGHDVYQYISENVLKEIDATNKEAKQLFLMMLFGASPSKIKETIFKEKDIDANEIKILFKKQFPEIELFKKAIKLNSFESYYLYNEKIKIKDFVPYKALNNIAQRTEAIAIKNYVNQIRKSNFENTKVVSILYDEIILETSSLGDKIDVVKCLKPLSKGKQPIFSISILEGE